MLQQAAAQGSVGHIGGNDDALLPDAPGSDRAGTLLTVRPGQSCQQRLLQSRAGRVLRAGDADRKPAGGEQLLAEGAQSGGQVLPPVLEMLLGILQPLAIGNSGGILLHRAYGGQSGRYPVGGVLVAGGGDALLRADGGLAQQLPEALLIVKFRPGQDFRRQVRCLLQLRLQGAEAQAEEGPAGIRPVGLAVGLH